MTPAGRSRIGVIVPGGNILHQREFERLRPAGTAFRFADFDYPPADTANFRSDLLGRLSAPFDALRDWGAEAVLLGCTTASMSCFGAGFQAELEGLAGAPVVTAAGAVVEAARFLGVRSLAVASPYGEAANRVVGGFLAGQGFEVTAMEGLGLDTSARAWATVPNLPTEAIVALARRADRPSAQAIYLPCTAMPSLEAIPLLEAATGKPAFSSVQAGYRAALRRVGLDPARDGAGRLLDR